jgi:hypothetical protein
MIATLLSSQILHSEQKKPYSSNVASQYEQCPFQESAYQRIGEAALALIDKTSISVGCYLRRRWLYLYSLADLSHRFGQRFNLLF